MKTTPDPDPPDNTCDKCGQVCEHTDLNGTKYCDRCGWDTDIDLCPIQGEWIIKNNLSVI